MTKLKININKADPPPEVIRKYKRFDSLRDNYHKFHSARGLARLWYRDKKLLAFIITLLMLLLIWVLEGFEIGQY